MTIEELKKKAIAEVTYYIDLAYGTGKIDALEETLAPALASKFPDNVTEDDKSKYFGRHFDVAEEVKDAVNQRG